MTLNDRCGLETLMFNQMAVHILVFMASAVMMLIFEARNQFWMSLLYPSLICFEYARKIFY